jgi:3,4-dihydroxy 2-butanone 4-phosphate synthase/GTP cyclohydrolase II
VTAAPAAGPAAAVADAVRALSAGRPVIVVDDTTREDEADLIFAAAHATPELVSFVVRHTSGFLCAAVTDGDADRLDLPPMHHVNEDRHGTAYAVSVDARRGTGTGISAHDRAATLRLLAASDTIAADLTRPGHVVPLRARRGGVLARRGHTEAAVDLMQIAGLAPVAGLCELVSVVDPIRMAHGREVAEFGRQHGLVLISVDDIVEFRLGLEWVLTDRASATLPLEEGAFTAIAYHTSVDQREHVALVHGEIGGGHDVVVRVQEECVLSDLLGARTCACRHEFDAALDVVSSSARGVVLYLRATEDQVVGNDRPGVPLTDAQIGAQMLIDLGVRSLRLVGDHAGRWRTPLERRGLQVTGDLPLPRRAGRTTSR